MLQDVVPTCDMRGNPLKYCSAGQHYLPPTKEHFSLDASTSDGFRRTCKACEVRKVADQKRRARELKSTIATDTPPTGNLEQLEAKADDALDKLYNLYGRTSKNAYLLDQVVKYIGEIQAIIADLEHDK